MNIALYSDSSGLPGSSLYATSFLVPGLQTPDWYGASGLAWSVAAGTYWAVFTSPDTNLAIFSGAPSPLAHYASNFGSWAQNDNLALTLRVDGNTISPVPLPASGFLLFGAVAGLGALNRRRA